MTTNYLPEDSNLTPETLAFLHSPQGAELLRQVPTHGHLNVAQVSRLRQNYPAPAVHAALVIASLQQKAQKKFPQLAPHTIWSPPEALEQATDSAVARHKASRFKSAGATHIFDLCSGIGGDALALAAVAKTLAIDLSPVRLACLQYNAENLGLTLETLNANIETLLTPEFQNSEFNPQNAFFHLDPSRRTAGKRSAAYQDLIPPPKTIENLMNHFHGGALKLSSAIQFDDLPPGHLELISHNRSVVQAVLWVGKFADILGPAKRTATTIVNQNVTSTHTAAVQTTGDLKRGIPGTGAYLYEADGALTRAALAFGLARQLNLQPLTSDAGYLLAPHPSPHPALTEFRILAACPYSEKRAAEMLRALPPSTPGPTEVKTRGKIPGVDTDSLQKIFSKASPSTRTILIYRAAGETIAIAAERTPPQSEPRP